jgi:hypothetical protein
MTPERLDFPVKPCLRRRRRASFAAHSKDAAPFLGNRLAGMGEAAQ